MRERRFLGRAGSVVTAIVLVLAFAATPAKAATMFPSVSGQNLNGRALQLPSDFKAPASIVFIAYVRAQQAQVDSWKGLVTNVRERFPTVGVYEVPTLPKGDAFFRWFIDGGMRRGIPDTATRDVTITLYIDKAPFNDALGIVSEGEITVLLVQPNGTVLWRSTGSFTPAKGASLTDAVSTLGEAR